MVLKMKLLEHLKKSKQKITLKNIEKNLYTKKLPNPDILIRTGGHQTSKQFYVMATSLH